jgi:hypothetical protein
MSSDPLAGYKALVKRQKAERLAEARKIKQQNDAIRAAAKAQIEARKQARGDRFKAVVVLSNFFGKKVRVEVEYQMCCIRYDGGTESKESDKFDPSVLSALISDKKEKESDNKRRRRRRNFVLSDANGGVMWDRNFDHKTGSQYLTDARNSLLNTDLSSDVRRLVQSFLKENKAEMVLAREIFTVRRSSKKGDVKKDLENFKNKQQKDRDTYAYFFLSDYIVTDLDEEIEADRENVAARVGMRDPQGWKAWIRGTDNILENKRLYCLVNYLTEIIVKNMEEQKGWGVRNIVKRLNFELLNKEDDGVVTPKLIFAIITSCKLWEEYKLRKPVLLDSNDTPVQFRKITDGCCAEDMEIICKIFPISFRLITTNERLIKQIMYGGKSTHWVSVIGVMFDNHFLPIEDNNTRYKHHIIGKFPGTETRNASKSKQAKEEEDDLLFKVDFAKQQIVKQTWDFFSPLGETAYYLDKFDEIKEKYDNNEPNHWADGWLYDFRRSVAKNVIEIRKKQKEVLSIIKKQKPCVVVYGKTKKDLEQLWQFVLTNTKVYYSPECSMGYIDKVQFGNVLVVRPEDFDVCQRVCEKLKTTFTGQSMGQLVKQISSGYDVFSKYRSRFNSVTENIICNETPAIAYNEQYEELNVEELMKNDEIHSFDANSFYASSLEFLDCVYSVDVLDEPEEFLQEDEIEHNFLYLLKREVRKGHRVIRFDGWYFGIVVKYVLKHYGYDRKKITKRLRLNVHDVGDKYREAVHEIYEKFGKDAKLIVCRIIGCFYRKAKTIHKIDFALGRLNARQTLLDHPEDFQAVKYNWGGLELYKLMSEQTLDYPENQMLLYIQIIQLSWLKNAIVIRELESTGLKVKRIDTDALTVVGKITPEISEKIAHLFGSKRGQLKVEPIEKIVSRFRFKNKEFSFDWTKDVKEATKSRKIWYVEYEGDYREKLLSFFCEGRSGSIEGGGGCGKTTLIRQIIKLLEEQKRRVVVIAPTNKAVCQFPDYDKKYTVHKYFRIYCDDNTTPLATYDTIIVDEISMLEPRFYSWIYAQKKAGRQIILCGDFNQLPPVKYEDSEIENARIVWDICNNVRFKLTKNMRSENMNDVLESVLAEDLDIKPFSISYASALETCKKHIVLKNTTRIRINKQLMNKYKTPDALYTESFGKYKSYVKEEKDEDEEEIPDKEYRPTDSAYIYPGLPVICHSMFSGVKDDDESKIRIYKNVEGVVSEIRDNKRVIIKIQGVEIFIYYEDFFRHFDCGYAITCHKAQGDTIREEYAIHEWDYLDDENLTYKKKWQYTAISRTSDRNHVHIVQ